MSVFNALVTGVSGLSAQAQSLATISDNIANVNTAGYKRVDTRFSTLVTQSNQSIHSPGGVASNPFHSIDVQGLVQATGNDLDLGVIGTGLFVVNTSRTPGTGDEYLYTRAGSFRPDAQGYLKNTAGLYLQGFRLDASGNLPSNTSDVASLETVNIGNITGTPRATSLVNVGLNLPANAATGETVTGGTPIQLFDTLGINQNTTFNWTKLAAANEWRLTFPTGNTAVTNVYSGAGVAIPGNYDGSSADDHLRVVFDSSGNLVNVFAGTTATSLIDTATGYVDMQFSFAPASTTQNISFNFGDATAVTPTGGDLPAQVTQLGAAYRLNFANQDGVAPGSFTGVNFSVNGTLFANFDNGETRAIYRLPVADFPAINGLEPRNGNAYSQTERSGLYILRLPSEGGAGSMSPGGLENSTVDVAKEFANMILTQRAYSANTKVISTADQMLQELLQTIRG
ncbi:MAG: flagellar hook protein FlgE [Dongiaceae bacterium]